MNEGEHEMNALELLQVMASMARAVRALYDGLVAEGFSEDKALQMCAAYLHGFGGGRLNV